MKKTATPTLLALLGVLLASALAAADDGIVDFGPRLDPGPYVGGKIIDDSEPFPTALPRSAGTTRTTFDRRATADGNTTPATLQLDSDVTLKVWSTKTELGYDVLASRLENGSWTVPQTLAGSPLDELDPRLSVDPADGSVHLVFWVHDEMPRVMHRQASADLSAWSDAVRVSEAYEYAVRPSLGFHDGALRIAYEAHTLGYGGTPRQIVLASRESWGFSTEVVATTQYRGPNLPEVHSSVGKLSIAWVDDADTMGLTWQLGHGRWAPVSGATLVRPPSGARTPGRSGVRTSAGRRD
jgi:hypothetical protein